MTLKQPTDEHEDEEAIGKVAENAAMQCFELHHRGDQQKNRESDAGPAISVPSGVAPYEGDCSEYSDHRADDADPEA
jgi:hypothetical protein